VALIPVAYAADFLAIGWQTTIVMLAVGRTECCASGKRA
jgi:hypothetical protein